jgi:amino acid transporter
MRPRPVLRHRSPVHGLDRRRLGPFEVLAQSVSSAAPAAAIAAAPAIASTTAGPGTLWSFAVATVVALLIGLCVGEFTRRMAVAGSLYSLTAQGLGPLGAFGCGVALLVGYAGLAMGALAGAAIYLTGLLDRIGVPVGRVELVVVLLVLGAVAAGGVLARVRLSARFVLLAESLSITLMVVVFTVLLRTDAPPVPALPDPGAGGIAAGVLPALSAFIGFEAATAMGVEARRPFRTIPRVVLWTAGGAGLLYLYATAALLATGALTGSEPVPALAARLGVPLAAVLDAGIALSFLACTLATWTALARVVFSMARDRIVPACLGATHPRLRTPHVAIAATVPVIVGVPAVLLAAGAGPQRVLAEVLTVATVGYLVAYLLVSLAAPMFLRRIGELTAVPVAVAAVLVPILLAALVAYIVSAWGGVVPAVVAACAAAGLGWLAVTQRRGRLATIGAFDETVTADVLVAP